MVTLSLHLVCLRVSRFGSGTSVSVASVSSSTPATDTAFSSAIRTTFVGSMMPASIEINVLPAPGIEPVGALAAPHAVDDHAAVDAGILRNLPCRVPPGRV